MDYLLELYLAGGGSPETAAQMVAEYNASRTIH
jgi:hypothetical protein